MKIVLSTVLPKLDFTVEAECFPERGRLVFAMGGGPFGQVERKALDHVVRTVLADRFEKDSFDYGFYEDHRALCATSRSTSVG